MERAVENRESGGDWQGESGRFAGRVAGRPVWVAVRGAGVRITLTADRGRSDADRHGRWGFRARMTPLDPTVGDRKNRDVQAMNDFTNCSEKGVDKEEAIKSLSTFRLMAS